MTVRNAIILVVIAVMTSGGAGPAWASDAFTDGLALFNTGEWSKAASVLVTAASKRPNDAVVRVTAGVALASVKRYSEAAEQFRWAVRLSPDGILPHLLLDGVSAEMGNTAESRRSREMANQALNSGRAFGSPTSSDKLLLESLEKSPQNAIAHLLLGDLYQMQNKLALAKEQYAKASELAPKWVKPVFNLGMADLQSDPKQAEQRFGRVIQMDPSNKRAYLWQGDAYLQQNQVGKAIEAYDFAAKDKALSAEARTRIGNAQLRAGNYAAASQEFIGAAKAAPQDARPIAGQAQVFQNTGKLQEAERKYDEAAGVLAQNRAPAPSQSVVQNQLGVVRAQQGKLEGAISNFTLSFEMHPTLENADALVSAQRQANRLQEGIAYYQAVLEKNPRNTRALTYLLSAYKLTGDALSRMSIANRLVGCDPTRAPYYYSEMGSAQMALGNASDAVDAYSRAFEAGNTSTWDFVVRSAASSGALGALRERCEKSFKASNKVRAGWILFELQSAQKDSKGMLDTAEALIKLNPDQATHWLRLGEAYEQAGSKDLAIMAYSKAAASSDPEAAAAARARIESIGK